MKLLALLGLDARVRRVRAAVSEGALAAEDRVQLLRMAWDDEKQRLKRILLLGVAVTGLTTVAVALLAVAVVVHFWDTPNRITAAWLVAGVSILVWIAAIVAFMSTMREATSAFVPACQELERDWLWFQDRFGRDDSDSAPQKPRPATREELLERIEMQRQRIGRLASGAGLRQHEEAVEGAPPADESAAGAALRIARKHPVAVGVATVAAVVVLKPRRLLRWAAFLAPVLWRMR
jgi:uncharacterized membrane protein YqjE